MNAELSLERASFWRSSWFRLIAIGVLAAVVLTYCVVRGRGADPVSYRTTEVERGDVAAKVSATGSLAALVTVEVGSQISGRIQSLFADFNSQVNKGQLIAKIDPSLYVAASQQARANLLSARASLERAEVQAAEAKRQAERARQLAEQKLISENDRDAAVTNARAAEASVSQAKAEVERARSALIQADTNLRYTDILAPTDGIVISRAVNVGQTVAASLQAPVLFTIAQDLRAMEVHTNVAESDIGRLEAGMTAQFTVDAYPGRVFNGKIREIRNAPQVLQNVVTYDAVIDVANEDLRLKPGMTASVSVTIEKAENVLRVPNAALRFQPPAATPTAGAAARGASAPRGKREVERAVWVLRDKRPVRVPVETGISDGTMTEIKSGDLQEGDEVVTAITSGGGQEQVRSRMPRIL
ncbi:MAG TPA: efflux RND transporter periplasmic adaptor subunit [Steroidobacteraceae bacterium]|nr:efflux RND transporter periplasmic adaptor subunit [Steroidobacteraceae bacterium]HRX88498.1 efflux RND transporter periplasmic adaptor subunit [Steroidobacteraceae bacterium]